MNAAQSRRAAAGVTVAADPTPRLWIFPSLARNL
jgi:hypothetical protein